MNAVLLGCRGLAVGHGTPVLHGVDLDVRGGESWCVVGANGSGKSTLLATLLGLLRPLAGTVVDPCGGDRDRVGFVPAEPRFALPLPLTVGESVELGLGDCVPRAAVCGRVHAALTALGIGDLRTRDVRTLSTGQRRRTALARALAREPRLLVLDEPTANLDRAAAARLLDDLESLRRRGIAIVHACHDHELAWRAATHVAVLAAGRVRTGDVARARTWLADAESP